MKHMDYNNDYLERMMPGWIEEGRTGHYVAIHDGKDVGFAEDYDGIGALICELEEKGIPRKDTLIAEIGPVKFIGYFRVSPRAF